MMASQSHASSAYVADGPRIPPAPPKHQPLPAPVRLDKEWSASQTREFFIRAYTTTAQAVWANPNVLPACKWLRSRAGTQFMADVARLMISEDVAPNAWLLYMLGERSHLKSPPRPEVVFEPTILEAKLHVFQKHGWSADAEYRLPPKVLGSPYQETAEKNSHLFQCWRDAQRRIIADSRNPSVGRVQEIVAQWLPDWERRYARSLAVTTAEDKDLAQRAQAGECLWASLLKR